MNTQVQETDKAISAAFRDLDALTKDVEQAYEAASSKVTFSRAGVQDSLSALFKSLVLDARRAAGNGMPHLGQFEPEVIQNLILAAAGEGLSLHPQSRHFYFAVNQPDYARAPIPQVALKMRGMIHLIRLHPLTKRFTWDLVHEGDTFKWYSQSERPMYESLPENMSNPLYCGWGSYTPKDDEPVYFLVDGQAIEEKGRQLIEADPSADNPWVSFPRAAREAEVIKGGFKALDPFYGFTQSSGLTADID